MSFATRFAWRDELAHERHRAQGACAGAHVAAPSIRCRRVKRTGNVCRCMWRSRRIYPAVTRAVTSRLQAKCKKSHRKVSLQASACEGSGRKASHRCPRRSPLQVMKVIYMHKKLLPGAVAAIAQTPQPGSSWRPLAGKLGTILSSGLMAAARWHRIRRAIHEVAQHDDRMLKDMGIHRSEIERAVRCGRAR
jgi:uncharacterized protein YjiS (DUF1127 family)